MPRVSVLLTCYNHINFLPAALKSIEAQTHDEIEIIAIDDGSSDGTREWLADNKDRYRLILNESNLGTYGSLNVALAAATGEFICVLNDDDLWAPTKVQRQLELMQSLPRVGLVHTDGGFIDPEGQPLPGNPLGFEFPRAETGDMLVPLIYTNRIIASAVMVRRECFEDVGNFNAEYFGSGDWEMWLRIAEKYHVGYVDEPLTYYRWHATNASRQLERIWKDDERLRDWISQRSASWFDHGLDAYDLRLALAHSHACLGTVRTLNGNAAGGRRAYWESFKMNPRRFKSLVRWVATFLPRDAFRKLN